MQPAYLVLENGAVFPGWAMGAAGEVTGEVVFTTAMTGYLETLTDPSYCGQIVVQTFPLMGNYGVIPADFESPAPALGGYVVGECCQAPSNFRSEGGLDAFLRRHGIPGVQGIDTRALVKTIRERGVMGGVITTAADAPEALARQAGAYRVAGAVERVTPGAVRAHGPADARHHVVLWDFGAKENLCRELLARDCRVTRVPAATTAAEIIALRPGGVLLSNGPGDPADNAGVIGELASLCTASIPLFGICLGHQLLALARGAETAKLHYGHRGANQPVRDLRTGKVYITSQNHGYAVLPETLPGCARMRFENANDRTCEGLDYSDLPAFSVQFHPEGCGGPMDTRFLFDRFITILEGADRQEGTA